MRVKIENLLPNISPVELSHNLNYSQDIFRFSLADFAPIWRGFPNYSPAEKRERLEKIFNPDYFEARIVVSDYTSVDQMIKTNFSSPSPKNSSGFIYIYTFEDNVLAGKYSQGMLWWTTDRYEAKLKIGCTEQNVFNRIEQQLRKGITCIPEPPILLASFWTPFVVRCERSIHDSMKEKRWSDNRGKPAQGGIEWFKDTPSETLETVIDWVDYYRTRHTESPDLFQESSSI